ncbi:hypothetical protein GC175_04975 [bacterium]|nr:hypothetical protein [bacterium]
MTNEQRFLHILTGDGPDFVYEQKTRFDLLTELAPPVELLQALQRQEAKGSVPESTAAWAARWRALERVEVTA